MWCIHHTHTKTSSTTKLLSFDFCEGVSLLLGGGGGNESCFFSTSPPHHTPKIPKSMIKSNTAAQTQILTLAFMLMEQLQEQLAHPSLLVFFLRYIYTYK